MIKITPIRARSVCLSPHLDERERRLLAATEARLAGYGGIAAVARATGVAASTIGRGLQLGFQHFRRRDIESPRIDLTGRPEFLCFRSPTGIWKNSVATTRRGGRRRWRR